MAICSKINSWWTTDVTNMIVVGSCYFLLTLLTPYDQNVDFCFLLIIYMFAESLICMNWLLCLREDNLFFTYFRGDHELYDVYLFKDKLNWIVYYTYQPRIHFAFVYNFSLSRCTAETAITWRLIVRIRSCAMRNFLTKQWPIAPAPILIFPVRGRSRVRWCISVCIRVILKH